MITSARNPKIQWVRALQSRPKERREARRFVVEGVRLAEEALQAGWEAELVLYSPELSGRGLQVVERFVGQGAAVEQVEAGVLRAASDTQNPQGLLAILPTVELPFPEKLTFLFIPDGVRDPGNLGAMLRTAAAAGVEAVCLPPGAADPFAPKVVRAAMGAHFRLPLRHCSWEEIAALAGANGLRLYLADVAGGEAYTRADLRLPLALVIGGEAEGAGSEAQSLAQGRLHIPMPGGVESLNAASAAAVLLFEVLRQRGG
jgi:TrmH family RNA methyltransferase